MKTRDVKPANAKSPVEGTKTAQPAASSRVVSSALPPPPVQRKSYRDRPQREGILPRQSDPRIGPPVWLPRSQAPADTPAVTSGPQPFMTPVQRASQPSDVAPQVVHRAAQHGVSGPGESLPFLKTIQQSFGRHDVSKVVAHTDGAAVQGARAMHAEAFTVGNQVAFGKTPTLRTAAHEAAHTIQQQAGVQLLHGVGRVGDRYEQHADAVAERVVEGRSSEALLDVYAPKTSVAARSNIQRNYEAADSAEEAQLADDPTHDRPGRVITSNCRIFKEAGGSERPNTPKLQTGDLVSYTTSKSHKSWGVTKDWSEIQVQVQGGVNKANDNITGWVHSHHIKPIFKYEDQAGVPLLTPKTEPKAEHVKQGTVGDCYLMAAMMTVADKTPQAIKDMFSPSIYDTESTDVAVRFYETKKNLKTQRQEPQGAKWVRVKKSVIVSEVNAPDSGLRQGGRVLERGSELWPAMIEKAFAVFKNTTYVGLGNTGFISDNVPSIMAKISGIPQRFEYVDYDKKVREKEFKSDEEKQLAIPKIKQQTMYRMLAILKHGGPVFMGTASDPTERQEKQKEKMNLSSDGKGVANEAKSGGLANKHAYSFAGLEKDGGRLYVKVRNPWGEYGRSKYGNDGKYKVTNDAISYIEFNDFLDVFKTIHHSASEEQLEQTEQQFVKDEYLKDVAIED